MDPAPWSRFADAAPEFAAVVAERLAAHPHHILGTIRASGAPRLSGINVMIDDGELWVGSMPGARKVLDLRRDPRCAVHSAPLDESLAAPDVRVDAVADELEPDAARYWLAAHGPPRDGDEPTEGEVFFLRLTAVSSVTVDGDQLRITSWRPGSAVEVRARA